MWLRLQTSQKRCFLSAALRTLGFLEYLRRYDNREVNRACETPTNDPSKKLQKKEETARLM